MFFRESRESGHDQVLTLPVLELAAAVEEEVVWGGRKQTYVNPDSKVWLDRMAAKGWTAPTWPKAWRMS